MCALLFICLLACGGFDALAQSAKPKADAGGIDERIKKMRDIAGKSAAGGDANASAGKKAAPGKTAAAGKEDVKGKEAEKELPPNESLPLGSSSGGLFGSKKSSDSGSKGGLADGWLLSTLAALGVVIAMVFGLRWVLRRGGIVSAAVPQGAVVEVLSRTTVAPKSHVLLMRVGSRILVVNDSPAGMRTLATVDDPEEFADLLGTIHAAQPTSMTKNFGGVMKKLSGQWSSTDPADLDADGENGKADDIGSDGVGMDRTRSVLANVRGRLASLSGTGGKA